MSLQDGLHPKFLPKVWALQRRLSALGLPVKIISGLRTYEQQAAIYAQGRTKPGRIVTRAKPGYSYHNFGLAVDWGHADGKPMSDHDYRLLGKEAKALGLVWGGDFRNLYDPCHTEYHLPGKSLAQMRRERK